MEHHFAKVWEKTRTVTIRWDETGLDDQEPPSLNPAQEIAGMFAGVF